MDEEPAHFMSTCILILIAVVSTLSMKWAILKGDHACMLYVGALKLEDLELLETDGRHILDEHGCLFNTYLLKEFKIK